MDTPDHLRPERFLARATRAQQRAASSTERVEQKMWEDIAQSWRELARQCALEFEG